MKSTFFYQCRTLREVKQKYKELAMKIHPDKGGSEDTMKQLNFEYELIINNPFFNFSAQSEAEKESYLKFPEIINKIIHLDLVIEICGQWVWISGNTYEHREYLRKGGFYYARNKQMWYWQPRELSSTNRKPLEMDKIRAIYGSDTVEMKAAPQLERRAT
jgi:curved DNA-binding protein CbpA